MKSHLSHNSNHVLLLNASEEIINLISWRKAVGLIFSGKAKKPYGHDEIYEIKTLRGIFELPTAVILENYVKVPFKRSSCLTKKNIMKRDGYSCQYCGDILNPKTESIDHIVPRSKGGKHVWENVVACCTSCNWKKADKTLKESGLNLKKLPEVPTQRGLIHSFILQKKNQNPSWKRWTSVPMLS